MGGGGGVEPGKGESGEEAGRHSLTACRAAGPREGAKGKVGTAGARVSAGGSREPGERGRPARGDRSGADRGAGGSVSRLQTGFLCSECRRRTSPDLGSGRAVWAGMWGLSAVPECTNQREPEEHPSSRWEREVGSGVGGRIEVVRERQEEGRLCLVWFPYQSGRKGSKIRN